MATYKCDIKQQFGKYSGVVWLATERPGDPVAKDEPTVAAVVDQVVGKLKSLGFAEGDEVIFRDTAYQSLREAKGVMLRSRY